MCKTFFKMQVAHVQNFFTTMQGRILYGCNRQATLLLLPQHREGVLKESTMEIRVYAVKLCHCLFLRFFASFVLLSACHRLQQPSLSLACPGRCRRLAGHGWIAHLKPPTSKSASTGKAGHVSTGAAGHLCLCPDKEGHRLPVLKAQL